MRMNGGRGWFDIPAEHMPGWIALVVLAGVLAGGGLALWIGDLAGWRGARRIRGWIRGYPPTARLALVAMVAGAAVHAAIVPTHWTDERSLAVLFGLDVAGFAVAIAWTLHRMPHWALVAGGMLAGTVGGYAWYLAMGWETGDPVGVLTSLVEFSAACALALSSERVRSHLAAHGRRAVVVAIALLAAVAGAGSAAALESGAAQAAAAGSPAAATAPQGPPSGPSRMAMPGMTGTSPSGGGAVAATGSAPGTSMTGMGGGGGQSGDVPADPMAPMGAMAPAGGSGPSQPPAAMPPMTAPSGAIAPGGASDPGGTTGTGGMGGMGGMGGGSTSGGTGDIQPLSLPTDSPAGPITWPLTMSAMPGMEMVTPDCTAQPTTAQQAAAVDLVNMTAGDVQPYTSLAYATAHGYVPITPTGRPVVHYMNLAYLASPGTLDPTEIESLVYANTPHGAVLVAAMYTMPDSAVGSQPPMPGGCLTEWHVHTNLCFSGTTHTIDGTTNASGACPAGSVNHVTQPMIHVWLAPVPGGPLVVDVTDATAVAAAEAMPVRVPQNGTA